MSEFCRLGRELFFMASENDARIAEHRLPRTIWMLGVRYNLGARLTTTDGALAHSDAADDMHEFRRDMQARCRMCYLL